MIQLTLMEMGYILMNGGELSYHHFHVNYLHPTLQNRYCKPQPGSFCLGYSKGDGFMYVDFDGFAKSHIGSTGDGRASKVPKGNGDFLYKEIPLEEIDFFHDRKKWKINHPIEIDPDADLINKFLAQD